MAISNEQREFLSRLRAVDMPPVTCTDCVPSVDGLNIEHAETCPVSIDVERVTAADAKWFEDHPGAEFCHRPATWGEGVQLMLMDEKFRTIPVGMHLTIAGKVRVEQYEPGVRGRRFDDVYFVVTD